MSKFKLPWGDSNPGDGNAKANEILVLRCWGQLLNVTFSFLSARCIRSPGFAPIKYYFQIWILAQSVAGLCMLCKVNSNSNHCLIWFRRLLQEFDTSRAAAAAHPLEIEVSRSRMSQFTRYFLPAQIRIWNNRRPYTVFHTGTLDGFMGVASQPLIASLSCVFFFRGSCACVVATAIYKQLCSSHLDQCCWF